MASDHLETLKTMDKVESLDGLEVLRALRVNLPKFGLPLLRRHLQDLVKSVEGSECAGALGRLLDATLGSEPETWGLRMLDASGKAPQSLISGSSTILGDYDECLDTRAPSFSGQYCLVRACISRSKEPCALYYAGPASRVQDVMAAGAFQWERLVGAAEGLPFRAGLCVPSVCAGDEVRALAERALEPLHADLRVELEPWACRVAGDGAFQVADYCAVALVMAIVLWCTVASVYDYWTRGRRRNEWVVAFSVLANGAALLHLGAEGRDALPPLHGVRVLAFMGVVLGHRFLSYTDFPTSNLELVHQLSKKPVAVIMTTMPMTVDAFLLLGGLLVAYVLFNHLAQGGEFKLLPFYLYRYFRLAPALGIVLLLQSTVIMKMNDGPLWNLQSSQQCPETWWYIMLHICNYFRPETVTCLGHTWYLSMDWHLYLLAPLALLALRRHPRRSLAALAGLIAVSVTARFVQAYQKQLRAPWSPSGLKEGLRLLYFPTHSRFEPYVVGIALGYVLHCFKWRSSPLTLTQAQAWALWSVSVVLGSVSVYLMWLSGQPDRPYWRVMESLFVASVHTAVAVSLAIVLFMTMSGYGGYLGWVLGHRWWRPLSRLTYCMYLVHVPVQNSLVWSARSPSVFSLWSLFTQTAMVWLLSVPPAALLALLCECPAVQMGRLLLVSHSNKRRLKEKIEEPTSNGEYVLITHTDIKMEQHLKEGNTTK